MLEIVPGRVTQKRQKKRQTPKQTKIMGKVYLFQKVTLYHNTLKTHTV